MDEKSQEHQQFGHVIAINEVIAELRDVLGDRLSTADIVREHHSHGESYHKARLPDAVAYPQSTQEVSDIVRLCAGRRVPIVPFGIGSSLEGHVVPVEGGISIDLTRMNAILRVSADDLDATVQAGVTHRQLNEELNKTGLYFPLDPGADATLGGMAATGASGTTAVRYGTMRETVLGLTIVLPDGRVVKTGGRARKSSAGYDLTRLFIGSEGTLGVITELTVRLRGLPESVAAAVCSFESVEGAVAAVMATIQFGIPVARVELLDAVAMEACNRYSRLELPVAPTLFFEFHGPSNRAVDEQAEMVQEIATAHGGTGFRWATKLEERTRLWKARHDAYFAALALRPGARMWTTDVCVPISKLGECISSAIDDVAGSSLYGGLVGHVGDGNFHMFYLVAENGSQELDEARRLNDRLVRHALAVGGTCTGEHGIGLGKSSTLALEHGDALPVMQAIKDALDPQGIMNPGKMGLVRR